MKIPPPLPHFALLNATNDYGSFTPTFSCHWLPCVDGRMGYGLYLFTLNPEGEPAEKRSTNLSAELLKVSPETPDPAALRYAAAFIRRGELVAVPTDTFYGIAADPFNLAAVGHIYQVKGRPETRALPILVNSMAQAVSLARDVPYTFHKLAQKFCPAPSPSLFPPPTHFPPKVPAHTAKSPLRCPKPPITCALIIL